MTEAAEQNRTISGNAETDEVDQRLATLLLENPTVTDQELADRLGLSRQTVNRRRNAPPVQNAVRKALSIPEGEVRRLVVKAMTRLETLIDHPDPKIQLAATLALLRLSPGLRTGPSSANMIYLG